MKKIIICVFALIQYLLLPAQQSVGIGTATPNASALLDVTSTTKGFLMPRMTTAQRIAITGVAGLIIYDADFKEFYHHDGITWKKILNNEFWNSSPIRSWIYNINDSIGLGTSTPDAKFEVIGNVKTSARIDAGGIVEAGGLSSLGTLYVNGTSLLQGAVTGNSTAAFSGTITSNSGVTIDDPSAILQLKNSGVSTGFVQLSGENMRLGTNSGNINGNVTLRLNGQNFFDFEGGNGTPRMNFNYASSPKGSLFVNSAGNFFMTTAESSSLINLNNELYVVKNTGRVGIGVSNPAAKLHVSGSAIFSANLEIGGRISSEATGLSNPITPLCYGYVSGTGSKISGTSNFTSAGSIFDGEYYINCPGITANSIIIVTLRSVGIGFALTADASCSTGECFIAIKIPNPVTPVGIDNAFNFIVY